MRGIKVVAGLTIAGCLLVGVLEGCSGSTTSNTGNGSGVVSLPVPADQFANSYAHAACDDMARCCTANSYGYDQNACLAAAQGLVQAELVNPASVAGSTYDANAAGECVARVRQAVQACAQADEEARLMNNACSRVYTGTKKPGETCNSGSDCAGSPEGRVSCTHWTTSTLDAGSSSGAICTVRKSPAAVGDPCDTFTSDGAPPTLAGDCTSSSSELRCDSTTKTCQPRLAIGEKCTGTGCTKDAYCNYKTQLCAAKLKTGEACTSTDDCDALSYCDIQATKTCQAKKAAGAACQSSAECSGGSCKKSKCLANKIASPELCGGAAGG